MRAHLTTNQQHGMPCLPKQGPLPDWPVWTRERMISGAAAERKGSQDEKERGQPPQDKRAEALTPVLSLRAPKELSLRGPKELSPRAPKELSPRAPTNERESAQAFAPELSPRAPSDERAQALDPEMSLRATDQVLPSQAGTEPLAWTTMRANTEETIVISAQTLGTLTTTLELSPYNQAKLDEV